MTTTPVPSFALQKMRLVDGSHEWVTVTRHQSKQEAELYFRHYRPWVDPFDISHGWRIAQEVA